LSEKQPDNVLQIRMCKCGRAPHRSGQRNCHFCNREANKRYQQRLKRDANAFKEIAAKVRSI
jgi:hypothetical protein